MANKDQVIGFKPFGKVVSSNIYEAGSVVYPGDLVKMAADGQVDACTAGAGVAIGVALNYASAAGQKVLVADSPDQRFIIQSDDSSIDAQTDMGLNYDITVSTASTLYKRSAMELDGSTGATNSDYLLRLLKIEESVDNALGAAVDCIVKINNHQLGNKVEGL
jgi:hypothetical protein